MPADFALKIIYVVVDFQKSLLEGLPEFVNATKSKKCANPAAYSTYFVLKPSASLRNTPKFDLFYRIRNLNYGDKISNLSGYEFAKMMLYDTFAKETIATFDVEENGQRDGIIYANDH